MRNGTMDKHIVVVVRFDSVRLVLTTGVCSISYNQVRSFPTTMFKSLCVLNSTFNKKLIAFSACACAGCGGMELQQPTSDCWTTHIVSRTKHSDAMKICVATSNSPSTKFFSLFSLVSFNVHYKTAHNDIVIFIQLPLVSFGLACSLCVARFTSLRCAHDGIVRSEANFYFFTQFLGRTIARPISAH